MDPHQEELLKQIFKQGGNYIDPHKELEKDFQSLIANMNKSPEDKKEVLLEISDKKKVIEETFSMNSNKNGHSQVTLNDLLMANMLVEGEELCFKNETAHLIKNGHIYFKNKVYTSLSNWAKEVATMHGLSKHYNGWKVVYVKRFNRPLWQFREKYLVEKEGKTYQFPPLETRKRKRVTSLLEFISSDMKLNDSTASDTSNYSDNSGEEKSEESTKSSDCNTCTSLESNGKKICDINCYVCNKLSDKFLSSLPTCNRSDILQVVLFSLSQIHKGRRFFSLGEDIYTFIDTHWDYLCSKPKNSAWKQTAKMTLSHNRYSDLFENGYDTLMTTGFWRLKTIKSSAIRDVDIESSNFKYGGKKTKKAKLSKKSQNCKDSTFKDDKSTTRAANVLLDVKNLVNEKKNESRNYNNELWKIPSLPVPMSSTYPSNLFQTFNVSNNLNTKQLNTLSYSHENFKVEEKTILLNTLQHDRDNGRILSLLEHVTNLERQIQEERKMRFWDSLRAYNTIREMQSAFEFLTEQFDSDSRHQHVTKSNQIQLETARKNDVSA